MKKCLFVVLCWVVVGALVPPQVFSQWVKDGSDEPKEDHAEDYFKWFYGSRTFGLGYIPQDAWLNALKQRDAMKNKLLSNDKGNHILSAEASQASSQWSIVGPLNIESGGSVPDHAGRVNSVVVNPTNPAIAYLGAADGGVWKTTNTGKSWHPTSDFTLSLAMGALAIDPSNPNILYAGTGEANPSIDRYFGAGILKTTDAGNTWQSSGLPNVGSFSKIIVNPHTPSTIYAAGAGGGGGLYISNNSGQSWTKISGDLPPGDVSDIAYGNNAEFDVLYAAVPSHGVFRSQDGGASWINVVQFKEMRRLNIGIDPNNWKDLAVLSANFAGAFEALQRTTDGGSTWLDISSNIGAIDIFSNGSGNSQGWYDAYIVRAPSNPDNMLVGGISVWKTEDGGGSWTDVGRSYQFGGIHPDQHTAVFANSPSDILYVGSDGGIAVSDDGGSNFQVYEDSLAITQPYGIAIDQTVNDLSYIGNQDNGTLAGGRTGNWQVVGGGDGGTVMVDALDHNTVYFAIPGTLAVNPISTSGLSSADSVGWLIPIAQDETNHILYVGSQFLYVRANGASSWTKRNKKLATQTYISSIAPAGDGKTLLIGTTGGKVWSTTDNGVSFTDRSATLPGRDVTCIKHSPTAVNTFYVTLSGFGAAHVLKTTDIGATWVDISSTLPDIPCNAIIIDDQHPTNLYIGTDVGVFFSPDDGLNWLPFGTGLPNVAVTDIEYHKADRLIRVGTHGRSMWEAPMAATISGITTPTVSNIWYIGESAEIGWYGVASPVKIEISTDNAGSWKTISDAATGSIFTILDVRFGLSESAIVRVTSGSDILQSQTFRIRQRAGGTTLTTFSEQPLYMYDVAFDQDDNLLWVTDFNSADSKIYKIDPDNGKMLGSITISGGRDFTGIKYDPSTKHLFVHQSNQSTTLSSIYEISTTGQIIHKFSSPCVYGTGIYVSGDSLFLADRNNNIIHVVSKQDPTNAYNDLPLDRKALFGPRCITLDQNTGNLLHTWTDFQGTDPAGSNASLYDSYILRLSRDDGSELKSWFVQDGVNSGTNVRGIEFDPRAGGTSVWVTVLNSGNSSKIIKLTLVDGPTNGVSQVLLTRTSFKANFPNPFSEYTTLPYSLDKDGIVKLAIRDVLGREVYVTHPEFQSSGDHQVTLQLGSLPSGRYFCELSVNNIRVDIRGLIKE